MKLNPEMFAQMRNATRDLLAKGPAAATKAIQQALKGLRGAAPPRPSPMHDINPAPGQARAGAATAEMEPPDLAAAEPPGWQEARRAPRPEARAAPAATPQELAQDFAQELLARLGVPGTMAQPAAPAPCEGARFLAGTHQNHAGSRNYKLYIPASYHGQSMPLLVMLHGCTQNPDDFAAGTQMNAVAEEMQCLVVYPEQAKSANHAKCWNWFNALDQTRGQGEPSIIAGIAERIMADYPVDPRRVFVAGLSAGGAMAVIVGTLYPELFAAVGVHSGLPFASAQDLPSALAAMKSGAAPARRTDGGGQPIIVFHGDRDTTVNPRNGELIAQRWRNQPGAAARVQSDSVPNGHRYTRTTHHHADGSPLGEHWVIHGAGHAWSGGSAHGSYTDGKGPDASREMMRFFKTLG